MKVYVLTDGQYDEEVVGVYSSAEAAMRRRPNLTWEHPPDSEGYEDFWFGAGPELAFSRLYALVLDADPSASPAAGDEEEAILFKNRVAEEAAEHGASRR